MPAKQGQFSLQGFVGAEYWIHVSVIGKELKAKPVKVEVKKINEPLKIVMPLPRKSQTMRQARDMWRL